jgi:hypothetical protein
VVLSGLKRKAVTAFLALALLVSLTLVPLSLIQNTYATGSWWNQGWSYRKQLVLSHNVTTVDLTNFPVLIDIIDVDLKSKARPDGGDIVFTYQNSKLNHEIESYDDTTGHLVAWVSVPLLSATTDTLLYMYYGNPGVTNQQNSTFVWDSGYAMVQHFDENSGTRFDSTVNGNNLTPHGNVTKSVGGKIDGADNFGAGGYEKVSQSFLPNQSITLELWMEPSNYSASAYTKFINSGPTTTSGISGGQVVKTSDRWYLCLTWSGGNQSMSTGSFTSNYAWNYLTVTWNGTYATSYVNGLKVKQANITGTPDWAGKLLYLGSNYGGNEIFNGTIDEVRISQVSRPAEWIQTCYNIERSPSSYWAVYPEEASPSSSSILIFEAPQNGTTGAFTNPTLSAKVSDPNGQNMNITFFENESNNWVAIGYYGNVPSGTYSTNTTTMNILGTTYYWGVTATDGNVTTSETFSLTLTNKMLQKDWVTSGLPSGASGVLCADINNDGKNEVITAGAGGVVALNGTNGNILWRFNDPYIGDFCQPEIANLNNDGKLEIAAPEEKPAGMVVLRANDGTVLWNRTGIGDGLGLQTFSGPVVFDIYADGHPVIFMASTDTLNGLNGTGRITAFNGTNGNILYQTFAWRPCGGGLSIADVNNDGHFELFMGDRNMYLNSAQYVDSDYGKGLSCYWANNLTMIWCRPDIFCSSPKPMLADVNHDGELEVITGDLTGGYAVLNATDGSTILQQAGQSNTYPTHYQGSVYDIDGDGHLEYMMADPHNTSSEKVVVVDLVTGKIKASIDLGRCFYGPQVADVDGDGQMEMVACNYTGIFIIKYVNGTYLVTDASAGLINIILPPGTPSPSGELSLPYGVLNYAVVADVDVDGYNELLVSQQNGTVYCFKTPARTLTPAPRAGIQFYSEYRNGVAQYVQPQGGPAPVVDAPSPVSSATGVPVSTSQLQFSLVSYQFRPMNYTVTTTPNIGSNTSAPNVGNGMYTVPVSNLRPGTTYVWTVTATDGTYNTNCTYSFSTQAAIPWYSNSWPYRKAIVINHGQVAGQLSNFPVLVDITDPDLSTKAQPNGNDILFTDSQNNMLPHEIESYNSSYGQLISWVCVPSLSPTTDTLLYMYYGNPSASDQENRTLVWDTDFVMVQHMEQLSGTRTDSTSYGNNAVPSGIVTKDISGKIDGADFFNSSGYEIIPGGFLPSTSITIEFWMKPASYSTTSYTKFINTGPKTTTGITGSQVVKTSDSWTLGLSWNSGAQSISTGSFISNSAWNYLTVTWDGTYATSYVNGQEIKQAIIAGTPDWIGKALYIASNYVRAELFNGSVDEIRISDIARTSQWIQTCYNNQNNPTAFLNLGTEETPPTYPIIANPLPSDRASAISPSITQLSFQAYSAQGKLMSYSVTTTPYIGSGSNGNKGNWVIVVPVGGLKYATTYTWTVSLTDGSSWTNETYTFTTLLSQPPTQSAPTLTIDGKSDLVCNNQSTTDPDGPTLTNIYHWYMNGISTTNLLLPFATNSSTVVEDYSGYGNNGTIHGNVQWTNTGIVGGACTFNRGFIQIPGSSSLDGGGTWTQITVECWIYLTASQSNTRIISRIPSYEIGIKGNKLFASLWVIPKYPMPSGYNGITYGTSLLTKTWYHVALVYNGTTLALYLNGTRVATSPISLPNGKIQSSGSNPLYIGWFDYFQGKIDQVQIYPKALSPQQILEGFTETRNGQSSSSTIVPQETVSGQNWICAVTPNDSGQDGITLPSNQIIIP